MTWDSQQLFLSPDFVQIATVNRVTWSWLQCADWTSPWYLQLKFSAKSTCTTASSSVRCSIFSLKILACCHFTKTCSKNDGSWTSRSSSKSSTVPSFRTFWIFFTFHAFSFLCLHHLFHMLPLIPCCKLIKVSCTWPYFLQQAGAFCTFFTIAKHEKFWLRVANKSFCKNFLSTVENHLFPYAGSHKAFWQTSLGMSAESKTFTGLKEQNLLKPISVVGFSFMKML